MEEFKQMVTASFKCPETPLPTIAVVAAVIIITPAAVIVYLWRKK